MITNTRKKILTPDEVISAITSEYPELSSYDLNVGKQFVSGDGREYNVFLVEAPDSPWNRFVAKGFWFEGHDLGDEVRMLDILQAHDVDAALPILPYTEGNTFLLLRYIEGENARDLLADPSRVGEIYGSIGATLKKIYSVEVPGFGKFWKRPDLKWTDFVEEKFTERLTPLIARNLVDGIREIYERSKDDIARDAKNGPVLIHRDIYTDNFLIEEETGRAVLIDFAMAIGGRPCYDLGKFYVLDVLKEPRGQEPLLRALGVERSDDGLRMLKTFILIELLGMIHFYDSIGDAKKQFAEDTLADVVNGSGKITAVLDNFRMKKGGNS